MDRVPGGRVGTGWRPKALRAGQVLPHGPEERHMARGSRREDGGSARPGWGSPEEEQTGWDSGSGVLNSELSPGDEGLLSAVEKGGLPPTSSCVSVPVLTEDTGHGVG